MELAKILKLWFVSNRWVLLTMLIVTAALLLLNFRGRSKHITHVSGFYNKIGETLFTCYGWPFSAARMFNGYSQLAGADSNKLGDSIPIEPSVISYSLAELDFVIAIVIIIATWFTCKYIKNLQTR